MIRNKLINGQPTLGGWISIGNSAIAEIFSRAGYDWVVVDLEHSTINIETCGELIRTIDLCGITPLVRITSNDAHQIKRIMDAGAKGIVVPSVNSLNDAKNAVDATRYQPQGTRGVGLGRAQKYGSGFQDYFEWQKSEPIVIVQIEHISAVDKLEEIFSVNGVDGFIIGPYDLSCSMGIPGQFQHEEFIRVITEIRDIGKRMKCPPGIHIVEPAKNELIKTLKDGYQLIAYGVDMRMLDYLAREGVACFEKEKN